MYLRAIEKLNKEKESLKICGNNLKDNCNHEKYKTSKN